MNLVKCIFYTVSINMIIWFFSLFSDNVVNYIDFQMLNQYYSLGIYPYLLMMYHLFVYVWIWFANILRLFNVHEEYWW